MNPPETDGNGPVDLRVSAEYSAAAQVVRLAVFAPDGTTTVHVLEPAEAAKLIGRLHRALRRHDIASTKRAERQ